MASFEWLLARRYLRLLSPRSWKMYLFSLLFVLVAVAARVALWRISLRSPFLFDPTINRLQTVLNITELIAVVAGIMVVVALWLIRRFTMFTSISTYGLFLGSAALVIVLSVMSGFEQDLKQKILGANAHILVTAPDRQFTEYLEAATKIRAVPGVESVTPYISNEVMISSQANLAGVILKGIDPTGEASVTDLGKNLEQGSLDNLIHPEKLLNLGGPPGLDDEDEPRPDKKSATPIEGQKGRGEGEGKALTSDDQIDASAAKQAGDDHLNEGSVGDKSGKPEKLGKVDFVPVDSHGKPMRARASLKRRLVPGVILGRELAKNLRVWIGDDINVISPLGDIGPAGPMPRSRAFRVAGIFYSGMYEFDTKYAYMTIAASQKFLGTDDEVTGLEVRVKDPDHPQKVDSLIRAAIDPTGKNFEIEDWQELNRNLFSALKVEKIAMFIVLCFIILVAGFSIVANGIMLVREKGREIAVLKSMGATDKSVMTTFLFIGLYMGMIGIGLGIGTGVLACLLLGQYGITLDTEVYYISKLPVRMDPLEIAAVCGAAFLIAVAATIYPALIAARLKPVESLHHNS